MRLFTAIDLPTDIQSRLDRLMAALRPEALIKWSPLDNLHITTKFIGDWPSARVDELSEALAAVAPRNPFQVTLKGVGWFPNERSPRVLWAGVEQCEPLWQLAEQIDSKLTELNVPRETREFSPHLTLARIKNPVPLRALRQKIEELKPSPIGSFQVSHFSLFRSDPGSNASIYRKLHEFHFEAALAVAVARS